MGYQQALPARVEITGKFHKAHLLEHREITTILYNISNQVSSDIWSNISNKTTSQLFPLSIWTLFISTIEK